MNTARHAAAAREMAAIPRPTGLDLRRWIVDTPRSVDDPGRIRWGELFRGRREWIAEDVSPEGLRLFGTDVVDPLRAMEDSGMIRIELRPPPDEANDHCDGVRIVEICSWVQQLIDEGDPGHGTLQSGL